MAGRNQTLGQIIVNGAERRVSQVHTAFPARVDSYDASTQTIDITPLVKFCERDPDDNERIRELPQILAVPVVFPRAGGFFLSFPIQQGDSVLAVCCESDIEEWQRTGDLSTPLDLRKHDLSYAVAIPGLYAEPDALADAGTNGIVIGQDGGNQVHITDSRIELGEEGAGEQVSIDSKVQQELTAIRDSLNNLVTTFNAHTHIVGGVTPGMGSVTSATGLPTGTAPAPVQATNSTLVTIKE